MKIEMKYLRRFNEELDEYIYRKAANKLKKLGHMTRHDRLVKHSSEMMIKNTINKWNKNIENYSKYGKFKAKIKTDKITIEEDFYILLDFSIDSFLDCIVGDDLKESQFLFYIGLIPTDFEKFNLIKDKIGIESLENGFIWTSTLSINYKLEGNLIEIGDIIIDEYSCDDGIKNIEFDRSSLNRIKKILIDIFGNNDLNYPGDLKGKEDMNDLLTRVVLIENSYSSDYGFSLYKVADHLKSISANQIINKS